MFNFGYCCINNTLRKQNVYTNRTIIKKNFTISKASELALNNVCDLHKILMWNIKHNIICFRISSNLFPRYTCPEFGYKLSDLKDFEQIKNVLKRCGNLAIENNLLISFHPGPFTTLASPTEKSLKNGVTEFVAHSNIANLIDPGGFLDIPINIHIGGSYNGTFVETSKRFNNTFKNLPGHAQKRLVVENDDKKNGWSVRKLYSLIFEKIGVPITIDFHHWLFCHDEYSMEEDFVLAKTTWGHRNQQIHHSESKYKEKITPAHSDYYSKPAPEFIYNHSNWHCHLECKQKELALLDYCHKWNKNTF